MCQRTPRYCENKDPYSECVSTKTKGDTCACSAGYQLNLNLNKTFCRGK